MLSKSRMSLCTRTLMVLFAVSVLPATDGRRVARKGRGTRVRKGTRVLDSEAAFLFRRDPEDGFPGTVLYEDGVGLDQIKEEYAWSRQKPGKGGKGGKGGSKTSEFDLERNCTKSEKKGKGMSKGSKAPSATRGSTKSTKSPSPSSPTISPAPSSSKGTKAPSGSSKSTKASGNSKGVYCEDTVAPGDGTDGDGSDGDGSDGDGSDGDGSDGDGSDGDGSDGDGSDGDGNGGNNSTVSKSGSEASDSNDVPEPDAETCARIRDQAIPNGLSNNIKVFARLAVEHDTTDDTVIGYLNDLRVPGALWVAGCEKDALDAMEKLKSRRALYARLLEQAATYATVDGWSTSDSCSAKTGGTCTRFKTSFQTWGLTDEEVVKKRTEEFLGMAVPWLESKGDIRDVRDIEVEDEDSFSRATGTIGEDDSNKVALGIGAASGALALLLLLILLIRRNRDDDGTSHVKLDDDGDDTFVKELASDGSDQDYQARNAHVVGEADSIFSGWTGYTQHQKDGDLQGGATPGKLGYQHGDVHICSSATCEVCENKRREGVQFVPTGTPPRPDGLPADASREYIADDTVEL